MKILTNKEAEKFIKKLYDINQIMKGIYKDEPNFAPKYILRNDIITYFDEDCIPEYLDYIINEPFNEKFIVIVDSKDFFDFFKNKDNKKMVSHIEIDIHSIKFKNDSKVLYECSYNKTYYNNMEFLINKYRSNFDEEPLATDIPFRVDVIKDMYNDNNKLMKLILDLNNSEVLYKSDFVPKKDSSYMILFLNKRFFNGISYKVKSLKKGDVIEYTPMTVDLHQSNDCNFEVKISIKLKNDDILEHHFIMCDF